ncbi:2-hydroxyacid dehydrogenase [Roseovarius aestuariivivens]|uniref:2-hydroxyacid dehydrogenase n=1 Tax=Roseovarius aestuariivivens TaxID=1888910 RepID=UPI00108156BF|nr:D-glycerate dehydrogenase [Roseovarius aestuariivivens]
MRIYFTRPLPESVADMARAHFDVEMRTENTPLKIGQMRAALNLYDGVLMMFGDTFSAEVFRDAQNPRCKVLANYGAGINHIDVAAARSAGVMVTNVPGAVTDATADIGMTLILMSARRAGEGERMVRAGKWPGWNPTQLLGLHVTGKTVGIVGMGRIGQAVARRCHYGFGMDVIYTARSDKDAGYPARRVDLPDLLRNADFVIVAVPASPETRHMIGADELSLMQKHAHLINVARGDIVDEAALIRVLQENKIGGAGLDVYENEPDVPNALKALENVTLLPHMGTSTLEVRETMGRVAVENLRAALAGEDPPNLVN